MNEQEPIRLTLMYQEIKDVREVHQDFEAAMCADLAVRMLAVMREMEGYVRERENLPGFGSPSEKRIRNFRECTRYWLKELELCFEEKHTGAA
jgi:hypothetical protein